MRIYSWWEPSVLLLNEPFASATRAPCGEWLDNLRVDIKKIKSCRYLLLKQLSIVAMLRRLQQLRPVLAYCSKSVPLNTLKSQCIWNFGWKLRSGPDACDRNTKFARLPPDDRIKTYMKALESKWQLEMRARLKYQAVIKQIKETCLMVKATWVPTRPLRNGIEDLTSKREMNDD